MAGPDLLERRFPGAHADAPREIPRRGWLQIAKRAWSQGKEDQISLLAAGVAFYTFLALFPLRSPACCSTAWCATRRRCRGRPGPRACPPTQPA